MKKVFWKCVVAAGMHWSAGKEYEELDGIVTADDETPYRMDSWKVFEEDGLLHLGNSRFQRIERDDSTTFEAHGHTWTRHTPGDPMPCDGDDLIFTILSDMKIGDWGRPYRAEYATWHRELANPNAIIGWRFADSAKLETPQKEPTFAFSQAQDGTNWNVRDFGCIPDDESERNDPCMAGQVQAIVSDAISVGWVADPNCAMIQDDMRRAAMDDGHLTPGQKAYIQGKEDAQAAKQQLKHDAEAKALQERADQLADAGKAMDRVNQGHDHRLGWMA